MDGACRDEDAVAWIGMEHLQGLFGSPIGDGIGQLSPVDALLQSCVDLGPRFGMDYVPGFRFSSVRWIHPRSVRIVWMDLDAEHLVAIKVLQEQWERLGLLISQDFVGKRIDQVAKSPAFPGAICNDALIGSMVDDFPAFSPGTGSGQRFSHQLAKAFSAP